jgi:beta-fructofuranosidase
MSSDGGKTWAKPENNPILAGEPDVAVTGFRDPYVARWPCADQLLSNGQEKFYGLVSGGLEGIGPTSFLYQIQPSDLTQWKYLGPLVELPQNFQPSKHWSGNYGINWECVNFLSFQGPSALKHFLVIGAEGGIERDHIKAYDVPVCLQPRTIRTQVWMSGDLVNKEGSLKFQYRFGGFLDHGSYYAANSFQDPRTGRHILYGWIPEEDITIDRAQRKGWNGSLAIPREIFLLDIPAVVRAIKSSLPEISCIESESQADGSFNVQTLGIKPISEVDHFRRTCGEQYSACSQILLPRSTSEERQWLYSTTSSSWELEATISLHSGCETIGFNIHCDCDLSSCTTITFSALAETIIVDRASSNDAIDINKCVESGPFTLFTILQPVKNGSGEEEIQESLRIRIFSDGDIVEIFANDRFALATMVYSTGPNGASGGISAFATGDVGSAIFESVRVWDDLNGGHSIVVDELDDSL